MNKLINTEEEMRAFTGASVALSIETLEPYLTASPAENEIIKILTPSVYEELATAYNDDTLNDNGNEHLKKLLPYAQKPLANLAIFYYMQEGGLSIQDGAIVAARDKSPYQWQQRKAEQHYLNNAYFSLDALIQHMITNKDDFTGWENSDAYKQGTGHFISTAQEFQKYVNIGESHRTFIALLPVMRNVESGIVQSTLTVDLYDDLKQSLLDENTDADENKLLEFLRPAVAYKTMAEAIDELNIEITGQNVFQTSLKSITENIVAKKNPEREVLCEYKNMMEQRAGDWLIRLTNYLNENASESKYPLYFNSKNYQDPDTDTSYDQDEDSNVFNAL